MTKTFTLPADVRTMVGHNAKQTRQEGNVPGTLYGKGVQNITLTVPEAAFLSVYKNAGETQLVDLSVAGDKHTVLIYNVQRHPVTDRVLNIEFYKVNLKEKLKTHVPLHFVGVSPAATHNLGTLLTLLSEVEIEALPADIPQLINVDVSRLVDVNMEIKVGQLSVPQGVVLVTDKDVLVARIGELMKEEPVPVAAPPVEGEGTAETPTEEALSTTTEVPVSEEK